MQVANVRKFSRDEGGAIAPLYALALFGIVGMAGVGFDYARVMALDTELQNAADQAALAAATQLDGGSDSISRAQSAVRNSLASAGSPYVNETRLSNIPDDDAMDGATRPITSLQFAFWESYVNDAPVGPVALDAENSSKASIVQVTINERLLRYALTPIVGAIVGRASGVAMASMTTAYCNVPPMMFCLPSSTDAEGNTVVNSSFPTAADAGKGLQLHMLPNGAGTTDYVGGIFGFLDIPYDGPSQNTTLGWNIAYENCTSSQVDAKTGVRDTESTALNTRFDIDRSGRMTCDGGTGGTGNFCPAQNVNKNWIRIETHGNLATAADANAIDCDPTAATSSGQGGGNNSYIWAINEGLTYADNTSVPSTGYPVDTAYNGPVGNGVWDFNGYMAKYHSGVTYPADLPKTRYAVYKWESDQNNLPASRLLRREVTSSGGGNPKYTAKLYCDYPKPRDNNGYGSTLTSKDRRVLSVAAVDCTGLHGSNPANIVSYVDLFLLTPADETGSDKAFQTEIIGPGVPPGASNAFQGYAKRKAVLIR